MQIALLTIHVKLAPKPKLSPSGPYNFFYNSTYLSTVTGATGQDLLDLKTRAVFSPPTKEPICGALVRFRDLFTPHKWRLRWGICSDPERCPFLENCSSLAEISCCTLTVAGSMVARITQRCDGIREKYR